MKKALALVLALVMTLSLAACGGTEGTTAAPENTSGAETTTTKAAEETTTKAPEGNTLQDRVAAAVAATDGKIAIITNTLSQNEEEYRSAQFMVEKYGADRITHDTMPDNFMTEQEQFVAVVSKYGADPAYKAIIINQACPGSNASIDKVLESRQKDDLLIVYCTPQENADDIVARADIVISIDEINKGTAIAEQAFRMGCKTFVHYSFPRHMAQAPLSGCRDLIKAKCEELGIEFVDATAPDPTSDAGVSGAQMFILEDVPKMVAQYGQETCFFSTNCSMQVPLIEAVHDSGAYYALPCCPSPYHGFPSALGIESPEDLVNGLQTTIDAIGTKLHDDGLDGHFSTWSVPASIANTVATTEYAFLWMNGEVGKCDKPVIQDLIADYCNTDVQLVSYEDPVTGKSYDNYLVYLQGFLNFGEPKNADAVPETTKAAEEPTTAPVAADLAARVEAAVAATDGKIAIITNTLSQNEEEYRSAQFMVEKFGADRITHDTMPDNFMTEQEQFVAVVSKYGADPSYKAIIINQACPGSNASIDKVLESRQKDDLLIVYCTPQENADDIVARADIVISIDEINKGTAIAQQAYDMGCKTFVHYSFPRHMAQAPLSGCRDLIKAKCEELGIEFVDATAPDPTSDAGVSGAQMFILEDVPKMVAQYGTDTCFFSTNCSMQVPLIEAVHDSGAFYALPCCPSPYHGFPSALGIESPEDLVNGLQTTIDAIGTKLHDDGLDGHFSTWSVPASIANTVATTEYAFLWMNGEVGKCDTGVIQDLIADYCNTDVQLVSYEDPVTGKSYDNYLVYLQGFLNFGEPTRDR